MTDHEDKARQADLYAYLLTKGDRWTRMLDAVCNVPGYPIGWNSSFHNSAGRRVLTRDIEEINASDEFEKIIVSSTRGIKLANERDFELFLASEYGEIFRKLRRVRRITRKGGLNMQQDLEGWIREAFLGGEQNGKTE